MLDSFLKLVWPDIKAGGPGAIFALLIIIIILLSLAMKKVWDAKLQSEKDAKEERARAVALNTQLIESRDKLIDRYSQDTATMSKALNEVERSLSYINGILSRM